MKVKLKTLEEILNLPNTIIDIDYYLDRTAYWSDESRKHGVMSNAPFNETFDNVTIDDGVYYIDRNHCPLEFADLLEA